MPSSTQINRCLKEFHLRLRKKHDAVFPGQLLLKCRLDIWTSLGRLIHGADEIDGFLV
jgi:hypothetical protein